MNMQTFENIIFCNEALSLYMRVSNKENEDTSLEFLRFNVLLWHLHRETVCSDSHSESTVKAQCVSGVTFSFVLFLKCQSKYLR